MSNLLKINDSPTPIERTAIVDGKRRTVWRCPIHITWRNMLLRGDGLESRPSYNDVSVVAEWYRFSVFKAWHDKNYLPGLHLDKDLKVLGNTIYGPDTCMYVSTRVNGFLVSCLKPRTEHPVGAFLRKDVFRTKPYTCQIWVEGRQRMIGAYTTAAEAHAKWQEVKATEALRIASDESNIEVRWALIRLAERLISDIETNQETIIRK